ncbi:hypothetical protein BDN72DRAFT_896825 [Pluteus cervinus]|uniref:Uncharacterized protein n=1 Tax=Pluteus cervinus TaxID=181527 RepID=A0ACD3AXM7_9AGAR|nr:hypothetical protein BDN72DRAFT_896825 [Pluteus cervinus]
MPTHPPSSDEASREAALGQEVNSAPSSTPEDQEELPKLLSFCPPALTQSPGTNPPLLKSFFDFYDAHVDEHLKLNRVVVLPGMIHDISETVASTTMDLTTAGLPLPILGKGDDWYYSRSRNFACLQNEVADATAISRFYYDTVAHSCLVAAPVWALFPHFGRYRRSIYFQRLYAAYVPFDVPRYDLEVYSLGIAEFSRLPQEVMTSIPRHVSDEIRQLSGKPYAVWLFTSLSPEAEEAIRDMDRLMNDFQPFVCQTSGHPRRTDGMHLPVPVDSSRLPCHVPEELLEISQSDTTAHPHHSADYILPNSLHSKTFSAKDFVQHAWTQAVLHDSTVIVFNTGNYERIGIRHRKSQTLFLSELIHIPSCKDPAYGKLHLGLYIGILQDALGRLRKRHGMPQRPVPAAQPTKLGKRPRSTSPEPPRNTRQKLNLIEDKKGGKPLASNDENFWNEVNKRLLGLVYLRYKVYNSSTPVACKRDRPSLSKHGIGLDHPEHRQTYEIDESMDIILDAPFSCGAVGSVHKGKVSLRLSDGTYLEKDVVVKLATKPKYRRRIRLEYDAYHLLWSKPVRRGILPIYGLFEECNDLATFMVMGNGGTSLAQRELDRKLQDQGIAGVKEGQVSETRPIVTPKEREMFVSILKACHRAEVCHRDIRPENLLINSEGEGFIIDFDRALLINSRGVHDEEMHQFKACLDGECLTSKSAQPKTAIGKFKWLPQ